MFLLQPKNEPVGQKGILEPSTSTGLTQAPSSKPGRTIKSKPEIIKVEDKHTDSETGKDRYLLVEEVIHEREKEDLSIRQRKGHD